MKADPLFASRPSRILLALIFGLLLATDIYCLQVGFYSIGLWGIAVLVLIQLLLMAIPMLFVYSLIQQHLREALHVLPTLGQLNDQQLAGLSGFFAPLLRALQPILSEQNRAIIELNNKNELFADALDEINEMGLQLRRSERRWSMALDATGDGIWEWDVGKDSWYFSPRWKSMLGYAEHELRDEAATLYALIHPDDVSAVGARFSAFLQGQQSAEHCVLEAEFRMQHKAGHWLNILSRAVAYRDAEGQILNVVGAQSDVTEQRCATADLSAAKDAAELAVAQLRSAQLQMIESEKLAALGSLVAGVAHEVNTPLGIALTAASTLSEDTQAIVAQIQDGQLKKTELQHYLGLAQEASALILKHCDNAAALIRSFKNISVDQTSDALREFNLGAYLDEILQSLKPSLKQTPHHVELACPPELMVRTYPGAFTQILNNLLNNAILHAFPPDQVGSIMIQAAPYGDRFVELRFIDNGVGIAPSVRAKVFEPFYTTKRGQGGSGLGMSIVHNLVVAQLKGTISIEETPGGGASFVILFPRVL
ncbi:PAS domain-containing sensor histidine kinase [Chitinibacter sp. GC72]|uniref:PAS domain-containing sensor histidine kinase n=1 Tax=Chitinibacter sp. GC72 TaxID=1526917 RepID=UPI0018DEF6B6|nr:PAS domain-containing sensor histidine kinase [Chitinibacter sp. GC72]